jgi:hypothetical protein
MLTLFNYSTKILKLCTSLCWWEYKWKTNSLSAHTWIAVKFLMQFLIIIKENLKYEYLYPKLLLLPKLTMRKITYVIKNFLQCSFVLDENTKYKYIYVTLHTNTHSLTYWDKLLWPNIMKVLICNFINFNVGLHSQA